MTTRTKHTPTEAELIAAYENDAAWKVARDEWLKADAAYSEASRAKDRAAADLRMAAYNVGKTDEARRAKINAARAALAKAGLPC